MQILPSFTIIENNIIKKQRETVKICDVGSEQLPRAGFRHYQQRERKHWYHLIESNKKKCAFLGSVIKALNLNSFIINDRAENIENNYDLIIARAVAPLPKFFEYCKKISKKGSIFILPKGKKWEEELDQLKKKWNYKVNIVKNNKMIDKSGGVTLVLSNVKKNE